MMFPGLGESTTVPTVVQNKSSESAEGTKYIKKNNGGQNIQRLNMEQVSDVSVLTEQKQY